MAPPQTVLGNSHVLGLLGAPPRQSPLLSTAELSLETGDLSKMAGEHLPSRWNAIRESHAQSRGLAGARKPTGAYRTSGTVSGCVDQRPKMGSRSLKDLPRNWERGPSYEKRMCTIGWLCGRGKVEGILGLQGHSGPLATCESS